MPEYVYPSENSDTKLVNVMKREDTDVDVYIGPDLKSIDIQPQESLQNPFNKNTYGREYAVLLFKLYFYNRYLNDPDYRSYIHSLHGKTIGCVCLPKKCHGEIIINFLIEYEENGTKGILEKIENDISNLNDTKIDAKGYELLGSLRESLSIFNKHIENISE